MNFINRHRCMKRMPWPPALHPGVVVPRVIERPDDGGRLRRCFGMERKRVCLINAVIVVTRYHVELVGVPRLHLGYKALPDSRTMQGLHRMSGFIPPVKVPRNVDGFGVRCPNSKFRASRSVLFDRMRTQFFE